MFVSFFVVLWFRSLGSGWVFFSRGRDICVTAFVFAVGYIAQWLERLTADQQVPGSNPGVPFCWSLVGRGKLAEGVFAYIRRPGIEPGTI
jgi:hypothetical protein